MLRFALLLLVGMSFADRANAGLFEDIRKENVARVLAIIKEGKLPPVFLNERQKAKLPLTGVQPKITWLGAGRQKDGKIFVCYVTLAKDNFGIKILGLKAGTFEADGSFQESSRLSGNEGVLSACWRHGFRPPVKLRGRPI
jgi:hypothetical protein